MKILFSFRSTGARYGRLGTLLTVAAVQALFLVPGLFAAHPGDTEPNQVVDMRDLLAVRNRLGQTGAPGFTGADLDSNGVVDNADLLIWRQNFPYIGVVGAPYLFIASPLDGSLIGDRRPNIVIDYGPTALNVDPETLQVVVDGVDRSDDAIKSFRGAVVTVDEALADGPHYVEAGIQDVQGTTATARSDFELTPITLLPTASPRAGPAPLEVFFEPNLVWADSAPAYYRWDWDDDGTYEIDDPRPDRRTHTFHEEGVHTIRFQVQQSNGTLTTTTLTIAVTESFASVSPSNGTMPLTVYLHGIAADLDDPIVLYEWDFDYDGSFVANYSSTTEPNLAHQYIDSGVYHPVFRATHDSSAVVDYPIVQKEVHVKMVGSPTVSTSAAQGINALTVNFSATALDDGSIELYEWDFDDNGTWDYSSTTSGNVSHAYSTAGVRVAAVRVTDNDTNSTIDRVRFETFAPAELEVLDDTVIPANDETVTIRTTTTIDSTVWLYLRAKDQTLTTGEVVNGRVIRTLVDHESRPAGMYDDLWDGRDFRYEPCHPDAYYAVLQYSYPGRTDTIDLADFTGGDHYLADQLTANPGSFSPFLGEFWEMKFEIPTASRASLYILPGGTNRVNTPFDNLAMGAGTYTYWWAGLDSEGQFVPSVYYLWSVNGWTLPDNAIVVEGRPEIIDLQIDPTLYSPTDRMPPEPGVSLNFEIATQSSVTAKVISLDTGVTLKVFQTECLEAGAHSIDWDGRAANGEYLAPGRYAISFIAIDEKGNASISRNALMVVRY
ncbi:MAG: PKD domain-containing protein [Phycisphaerae bacterium]|nr:PKD domain-containing protein [Phycisphaerae bacterium]